MGKQLIHLKDSWNTVMCGVTPGVYPKEGMTAVTTRANCLPCLYQEIRLHGRPERENDSFTPAELGSDYDPYG